MNEIVKHSDQEISVTLKNADGTVLDLDTTADIVFHLYQSGNRVIRTFSKLKSTIDIATPANGVFTCMLDRQSTTNARESRLFAEIEIHITDADYEDGVKIIRMTGIEVADIIQSIKR